MRRRPTVLTHDSVQHVTYYKILKSKKTLNVLGAIFMLQRWVSEPERVLSLGLTGLWFRDPWLQSFFFLFCQLC